MSDPPMFDTDSQGPGTLTLLPPTVVESVHPQSTEFSAAERTTSDYLACHKQTRRKSHPSTRLNICHNTRTVSPPVPGWYATTPSNLHTDVCARSPLGRPLLNHHAVLLLFLLIKLTPLFFSQCMVYLFVLVYAFNSGTFRLPTSIFLPASAFFLSSKPEIYSPTNRSKNDSGVTMRMKKWESRPPQWDSGTWYPSDVATGARTVILSLKHLSQI